MSKNLLAGYQNLTDEALMGLYQENDMDAFKELYNRHSNLSYGYLLKKTRNETMAQDVLQASFLKLHENRDRYDTKLPFLPWFYVVIKNTLTDFYRKNKKTESLGMDAEKEISAPETFDSSTIDFDEMIAQVSPKYQSVIRMRYFEDLDFDIIARRLNTNEANIRKIVSRGIKEIKDVFYRSEKFKK